MSRKEMSRYRGTYRQGGFPRTDIYIKGEKLVLRYVGKEYWVSKVHESVLSFVSLTHLAAPADYLVIIRGVDGRMDMFCYNRKVHKRVKTGE